MLVVVWVVQLMCKIKIKTRTNNWYIMAFHCFFPAKMAFTACYFNKWLVCPLRPCGVFVGHPRQTDRDVMPQKSQTALRRTGDFAYYAPYATRSHEETRIMFLALSYRIYVIFTHSKCRYEKCALKQMDGNALHELSWQPLFNALHYSGHAFYESYPVLGVKLDD